MRYGRMVIMMNKNLSYDFVASLKALYQPLGLYNAG